MNALILVLFSIASNASDFFPHEVLLDCTVKMQRLGFNKAASDESCSISAGPSCTLLKSHVVQRSYPNCVGELIYLGIKPKINALQFCNMAARRKKKCVPQQYITDREFFVTCMRNNLRGNSSDAILQKCLEATLLR